MLRNRILGLARSSCVAILALLLAASNAEARAADDYPPVVTEFLGLMESRPDLEASVEAAIEKAGLEGIEGMDSFVDYVDDLVTLVPTEREVVPECLKFYYIVNHAPNDALNKDEQFNAWMNDLVRAWGSFLDTPASAAGIDTFLAATSYNIDDYHRYHVPVAGTVREVRNISGKVYMDVFREDDGTLNVVDGDTYQFNQERGLVVIDSPQVGMVAVLPIGMAYVSSVNLTTEVGAELRKGDQFGYFMFGGSDIVMVFQDRNIVLDAEIGKKYLQGQRLGELQ